MKCSVQIRKNPTVLEYLAKRLNDCHSDWTDEGYIFRPSQSAIWERQNGVCTIRLFYRLDARNNRSLLIRARIVDNDLIEIDRVIRGAVG